MKPMNYDQFIRHFIVILLSLFCVIFFQNCADDYNPDAYGDGSSDSSSTGATPTPAPTAAPTPTPAGATPTPAPSGGAAPQITNSTASPYSRSYWQNVNLSVTATGSNLTYQWFKNGSKLTGETGTTLNIVNAVTADAGTYSIVVTNSVSGAYDQADIDVNVTGSVNDYKPVVTNPIQDAYITVNRFRGVRYSPHSATLTVGATNYSRVEWYFKRSGTTTFVKQAETGVTLYRTFNDFQESTYFGEYRVDLYKDIYGKTVKTSDTGFIHSDSLQ